MNGIFALQEAIEVMDRDRETLLIQDKLLREIHSLLNTKWLELRRAVEQEEVTQEDIEKLDENLGADLRGQQITWQDDMF